MGFIMNLELDNSGQQAPIPGYKHTPFCTRLFMRVLGIELMSSYLQALYQGNYFFCPFSHFLFHFHKITGEGGWFPLYRMLFELRILTEAAHQRAQPSLVTACSYGSLGVLEVTHTCFILILF